jgi:pectinesterase
VIHLESMVAGMFRTPWLGLLWACCLPGCGSSDSSPAASTSATAGDTSTNTGTAHGSAGTQGMGGTNASGSGSQAAPSGNAGGNIVGEGGSSSNNVTPASAGKSGVLAGGASSTASPAGGRSTGGKSAVGASTGIASGGASAGPAATGGTSAGGAATGTHAAGRTNSVGGSPAGGKAAGGANQGGTTTGSEEAGRNNNQGGSSAGGKAAGGSATGGTSSANDPCPTGITQTITVAKDGSGQYTTVQSAVDSISKGSSAHIRINIKAGTYKEKLTIENRTNLCLVGDAADTTILTYGDSNSSVGSTSGSASVLISANDFSATQLTFQNSFGSGSQAVALRTTGQRQQFLNCRLVAYQDTLYVHSGTQYFRNCYVQGNTDYVFGGATAVLQDCEARNVEKGSAVAAPNTDKSTAYGIVFLGGTFTAASGISGVALARPWGADGAAAFLKANLGGHISSSGFTSMSGNDPANARFSEYQSTGSGANSSGRSSYQMSASQAAEYTIANIFGGSWTPSYSQ